MESNVNKELNDKFKRITPKRISNFRIASERLSKISSKLYYDYTEDEMKEILKQVDEIYNSLKKDLSKRSL
jgi:uncharacterized protein YecE (DUF72 family)